MRTWSHLRCWSCLGSCTGSKSTPSLQHGLSPQGQVLRGIIGPTCFLIAHSRQMLFSRKESVISTVSFGARRRFSVSFLSPCFFLYLLGCFEVTVTSVSLPPFVSRRGLSNTNQRLSRGGRGMSTVPFLLSSSPAIFATGGASPLLRACAGLSAGTCACAYYGHSG